MANRATERSREDRRHKRDSVFLAATLTNGVHTHKVVVRSISESGALIELYQGQPTGDLLDLSRGKLSVCATVAWSRNNMLALHFIAPIDVERWTRRVS
jgi:hypothetical protein